MDKRTANIINQRLVALERNNKVSLPAGVSASCLRQLRAIKDRPLSIADALSISDTGQNKMHTLIYRGLAEMVTEKTFAGDIHRHQATPEGVALVDQLDDLELFAPIPPEKPRKNTPPSRLFISPRR